MLKIQLQAVAVCGRHSW